MSGKAFQRSETRFSPVKLKKLLKIDKCERLELQVNLQFWQVEPTDHDMKVGFVMLTFPSLVQTTAVSNLHSLWLFFRLTEKR